MVIFNLRLSFFSDCLILLVSMFIRLYFWKVISIYGVFFFGGILVIILIMLNFFGNFFIILFKIFLIYKYNK